MWILLKIINKYSKIIRTELIKIAKESSLRGGGLPIDEGIILLNTGNFVIIENEKMYLAPLAKKIVKLSTNDEPTPAIIRELLLPIIKTMTPSWITSGYLPHNERIISIPIAVREVLEKAELLTDPLSDEGKLWWEFILNIDIEIDKEYRKKIGAIGEQLTMNYETQRLNKEGYRNLVKNVIQVSKKSDKYGFDISSYFGDLKYSMLKFSDQLMIEVKASTSLSNEIFRFYLTRNEWETAKKDFDHYLFYLWRGIDSKVTTSQNVHPLIIPSKFIEPYLPTDIHKNAKWTESYIRLDIEKIKPHLIKEKEN